MSRFLVAALFAAAGLAAVTAQPMDGKVAKKLIFLLNVRILLSFLLKSNCVSVSTSYLD